MEKKAKLPAILTGRFYTKNGKVYVNFPAELADLIDFEHGKEIDVSVLSPTRLVIDRKKPAVLVEAKAKK